MTAQSLSEMRLNRNRHSLGVHVHRQMLLDGQHDLVSQRARVDRRSRRPVQKRIQLLRQPGPRVLVVNGTDSRALQQRTHRNLSVSGETVRPGGRVPRGEPGADGDSVGEVHVSSYIVSGATQQGGQLINGSTERVEVQLLLLHPRVRVLPQNGSETPVGSPAGTVVPAVG